jgi:hypothetical protein
MTKVRPKPLGFLIAAGGFPATGALPTKFIAGATHGEEIGGALAACGNFVNNSGDCLAVGGPKATSVGGEVLVFPSLGASGLDTTSTPIKRTGASSGFTGSCTSFGTYLANAGNVDNSDHASKDDLLVGAPNCSDPETNEGRAMLYKSGAGGLMTPSAWSFESNQTSAKLGVVAGIGDVNDDGIPDFAVGAPGFPLGSFANSGRVFVFYGNVTGSPALTADQTIGDSNRSESFGAAIAGGFDFNADGISDFVIGAPSAEISTNANVGKVYIYHGSPTGPVPRGIRTPPTTCAGCEMGSFLGTGDIDADSYGDIVVSSPGFTTTHATDEGQILIYRGIW